MTRIPDDVLINYISPGGVTTDITTKVTYADAYFESQAAAVPGSFHIVVKDPDQSLSFTTGGRIELTVGGRKVFGGFVTVPTRDFFFPADDTSHPVKSRRWSLDGVDYNTLLDKRILRNPSDYTHFIPKVTVGSGLCNDHDIISTKFDDYFDLGFAGGGTIDISSKVRDTGNDFSHDWVWPDQGSTMRQTLDALVVQTTVYGAIACVFWLNAEAEIEWLALHDTIAPWGFSDVPDGIDFIGWREGSVAEDGSSVMNDVFVWGGSPLGTQGTVVLAHKWNADSITAHGRWQLAEAHPGEDMYKSQAQVDARANALISGDTSGTGALGQQGLVNPDMQYSLTWFSHDVPTSGGVRQHLVPGMVTTFNLWSFSEDGGITPYAVDLPLRQMRISFPTLPGDNPDAEPLAFVQFQGTFGLQLSDPVWWWEFLRSTKPRVQTRPVATTDNSSDFFPYGSYFSDGPLEDPGDGRTDFTITPAYIAGSLELYINGYRRVAGADFTESDPDNGAFHTTSAPLVGSTMIVVCRTA